MRIFLYCVQHSSEESNVLFRFHLLLNFLAILIYHVIQLHLPSKTHLSRTLLIASKSISQSIPNYANITGFCAKYFNITFPKLRNLIKLNLGLSAEVGRAFQIYETQKVHISLSCNKCRIEKLLKLSFQELTFAEGAEIYFKCQCFGIIQKRTVYEQMNVICISSE